jgi:single-stranded-DNA-specific exonuclease
MIAEEEKVRKRHTTVLNHDSWHKGVIGIVASRLIETHYRPTVIFTRSNGLLAGSARSVKGFDVYKALEECSDILEQFGGHMYAAGMTLNPDRFDDFKARFDQVVAESISEEMLIPEIEVDGSVSFADLTPKFFRILKQFAPFGPRNMAPTLVTHNLINTGGSRLVGADSSHLKVALKEPESGIILSGIGFGMADKLPLLNSNKPVSAAYHLEENNFRGNTSLQLHLKDLKLTSSV